MKFRFLVNFTIITGTERNYQKSRNGTERNSGRFLMSIYIRVIPNMGYIIQNHSFITQKGMVFACFTKHANIDPKSALCKLRYATV